MVCFDRTCISMFTNGVDISGLHVLTFSMQLIALDDYRKTLYRYNLGKISMPRIPKHLRERPIGMLEAGASMEEVSVQVGSSVQALRSLRRRFVQTGITDLPRSGRLRVTTPAQDHYILNQHLRNRFFNCDGYSVCHLITPGFLLKRYETVWLRTIYVHVVRTSEQN